MKTLNNEPWLKKYTTRLSREDQVRLIRYFRFEEKAFVGRSELEEVIRNLEIATDISALLRAEIIQVVLRNRVYRVSELQGTFDQLLPLLFGKDQPYYMGGLAAFNRLGFVDQVPGRYTVVNTVRSGNRTLAGFQIQFRKRISDFFYGLKSDGMMDSERAAIEFCNEMGFLRWRELVSNDSAGFNLERMKTYAIRYPINKTARRVLFGLAEMGAATAEDANGISTTSPIALVEGKGRGGRIDRTWGIIVPKS